MTLKEPGKKEPKKSLKSYMQVTSSVFQMGALIAIGAYGGKYLDQQYSFEKAWFTMLGTLLGLAAGLYMVLKSINSKS
jgi:F0F1-type ATP synthase assembly protein I